MQPYVIKRGDYLAQLAYKLGFDADSVWGDPSNADLRTLRSDPNLLLPGDVLQVPSAPVVAPPGQALTTGSTNSFVSNAPTVSVNLKFVDPELASQPFTVAELPALTVQTTGGDGSVTLVVPITQQTLTIVFSSDGTTFTCNVGHINPINAVSGVAHRLQNLGYLDPTVDFGIGDLDAIRTALREFRADQPGAAAPQGPASSPPDSGASAQGPDSSPPDSGPGSEQFNQLATDPPDSVPPPPPGFSDDSQAPASNPPPPSGSPAPSSEPAPASGSSPPASGNAAPPDSASPSSGGEPPPDSTPPDSMPTDNAGLDDNGVLDDATSQLLLTAHGS